MPAPGRDLKPKELLHRRYDRLQSYGRFADTKDR
jgi:acetyl-CoA carboxylase carboxyl transferase subunit alpha